MRWPALIFSSDLLPDSAPLNGRRWVSQLLFRLWLQATSGGQIDLLIADTENLTALAPLLEEYGQKLSIKPCSITDSSSIIQNGALFVPDPSIGAWAGWRQSVGDNSFSLIGQIHTLSTTAVMAMLDGLVMEPVKEWDALICSSTAGKNVVEGLWEDRRDQLRHRLGACRFPKPQIPVIPLPLDKKCFDFAEKSREKSPSATRFAYRSKCCALAGSSVTFNEGRSLADVSMPPANG